MKQSKRSSELISHFSGMPSSMKIIRAMDELSDTVCSVVDSAELYRNTHPDREYVDEANKASMKIHEYLHVHKSGSFGRSLDITRFSSYHDLRSELAHMFCLEGQLEDHLRSGWQLVFIDWENDVLLLDAQPLKASVGE